MIISENLILRVIEKDDLEQIAEWRNQPEIHKHFFSYNFISKNMQEKWLENVLLSNEKMLFSMVEKKSSSLIGLIGLDKIDFKNQNAEFGNLFIGDKLNRGKGYAKEAIISILKFSFYELNLHRIYLYVFELNKNAIELYKKCGFKREGILRDSHFHNGCFRNIVLMSILRPEYIQMYIKNDSKK